MPYNNFKLKLFSLLNKAKVLFFLSILSVIIPTSAAKAKESIGIKILNNFGSTATRSGWDFPVENYFGLFSLWGTILSICFGLVGTLFFAHVIIGSLRWILSEGNEEKIKKARKQITDAALGILVVVCAYLIAMLVFNIFSEFTNFNYQ